MGTIYWGVLCIQGIISDQEIGFSSVIFRVYQM